MDFESKIRVSYELAKLMYGQSDLSLLPDENIDKYLPLDIVEKLWSNYELTDEDGFVWGFGSVCAKTNNGRTYISYAAIADGQGYHRYKVYYLDDKTHGIICV